MCIFIAASINPFGQHRGSFFEGASKAEILKFLEVAKERVVDHLEDDILDDEADISTTKVSHTFIHIVIHREAAAQTKL